MDSLQLCVMTYSNDAKQWLSFLPTGIKTPFYHYALWPHDTRQLTSFLKTSERENSFNDILQEEMEA